MKGKDKDDVALSGQVAVYVRCRPPQSKELLKQQFNATHMLQNEKCVSVAPNSRNQKVLIQGTNKEFVFDRIFDEDSDQLSLFRTTVEPLLPACFQGFNLTILAYGQTGSGQACIYKLVVWRCCCIFYQM